MTLDQTFPTHLPRDPPVSAALLAAWHALELRLGAFAPTLLVFGPVGLLVHFATGALAESR